MKRTSKIIASIMTGIVALSSVAFTGCAGNETGNVPILPPQTEQTEQSSGFDVSENQERGVSLLTTEISESEYSTYGISAQAESAIYAEVSYTPSYVTYNEIDWEVSFEDEDGEWATGKVVTDYVKVTPTYDGANSATVECYGEFGERIILTAKFRNYPSVKAQATFDYQQRLQDVSVKITSTWGNVETLSGFYTDYRPLTLTEEQISSQLNTLQSNYWNIMEEPELYTALPMYTMKNETINGGWSDYEVVLSFGVGTVNNTVYQASSLGFIARKGIIDSLVNEGFTFVNNSKYGGYAQYITNNCMTLFYAAFLEESNDIFEGYAYYEGYSDTATDEQKEAYVKFAEIMNGYTGVPCGTLFVSVDNMAYVLLLAYETKFFEVPAETMTGIATDNGYTF